MPLSQAKGALRDFFIFILFFGWGGSLHCVPTTCFLQGPGVLEMLDFGASNYITEILAVTFIHGAKWGCNKGLEKALVQIDRPAGSGETINTGPVLESGPLLLG